MNGIGQRLIQERKRLGLTQASIAKIGGVKANAQSHYESGERSPRAGYLAAISVVGVDINYVVTGQKLDTNLVREKAVESIMDELHYQLWSTAQAISKLSRLMVPSEIRTPAGHVEEYLKYLSANAQRRDE
jgi:transcriptional regulator with XRE-family HTH domain